MMDEKKIHEILDDDIFSDDGGLYDLGWYLGWNKGDERATLDGPFTSDELKAIAWYMDNA